MVDVVAFVLAAIFFLSGFAKLVGVSRFRSVLVDTYQLPAPLATLTSLVVPATEVAIAMSLILFPVKSVGLAGALVLLLSIAVVVTRAWVRGASGECGCLGSLTSERLSLGTVVRVASLALVAGLALVAQFEWVDSPATELVGPALNTFLSILGIGLIGVMTAASLPLIRRNTEGRARSGSVDD